MNSREKRIQVFCTLQLKLDQALSIVNLRCVKTAIRSFFVHTVNKRNNFPKDVVHTGSVTLLRNRLKIYMDTAE